jgi:hypothetical protein
VWCGGGGGGGVVVVFFTDNKTTPTKLFCVVGWIVATGKFLFNIFHMGCLA